MSLNIVAQSVFEAVPGYAWMTDKQHHHIAGRQKPATLLGFSSLDHMIDISMRDIPCLDEVGAARDGIKDLMQQRDYVMGKNKAIDVLDVHPFADHVGVHHAVRSPYYNELGELVGVLVIARPVQHKFFSKMLFALMRTDSGYHKKNDMNRSYVFLDEQVEGLTPRELDCYFYLLRGDTAKMIADVLNRSVRTAEDYINNLRRKMACYSKADLIEKGVMSGLLYKIPKGFLDKNISIVLS